MSQKNTVSEAIIFPPHTHLSFPDINIFNNGYNPIRRRPDIPEEFGRSFLTCRTLNPFLELWTDVVETRFSTEMTGVCKGDFYCLSFCLSEGMEWDEQISNTSFRLEKDQGAFYHIHEIREVCSFNSGHHLDSFCIMIHPERFRDVITELSVNNQIFHQVYNNFKFSCFRTPPDCRIIIKHLQNCPYREPLRSLYIEGKVSELLVLCLHELSSKRLHNRNGIILSATDLAGLKNARAILDDSLASSVTIRQLSRMVGLNEHKLKKGFKQLFGTPVHTYLVEKRMQKARIMLETRSSTVSETAYYVGYSCPGSFSKAFSKKYGFNPSDCF